jgi:hypothetical protein
MLKKFEDGVELQVYITEVTDGGFRMSKEMKDEGRRLVTKLRSAQMRASELRSL